MTNVVPTSPVRSSVTVRVPPQAEIKPLTAGLVEVRGEFNLHCLTRLGEVDDEVTMKGLDIEAVEHHHCNPGRLLPTSTTSSTATVSVVTFVISAVIGPGMSAALTSTRARSGLHPQCQRSRQAAHGVAEAALACWARGVICKVRRTASAALRHPLLHCHRSP